LLAFDRWKGAGEDARRVLPLNKNIFWNWEILLDQRSFAYRWFKKFANNETRRME
jgi:hypothetical protein